MGLAFLLIGTIGFAAEELSDAEVLRRLTQEQPRDRSIDRGLAYLRGKQNVEGSIGDRSKTALTSLAVMAHLSAGHTLDDPRHGEWMKKSVKYVLDQQEESGYFGRRDGSRMYGHGIVTLMLAEALGTVRDDEWEEMLIQSLEKGVKVTVAAALIKKDQRNAGGWRYEPHDHSSDLSLSGWQLMSLHATQQVGVPVPETVIAGAVDYAKRLTTDDGKVGYESPGDDRPALRGLGMLCLTINSGPDQPKLAKIARRITDQPIGWHGPHFYYRAYYDAVGMSKAAPENWKSYSRKVETILLEHQNTDGSWQNPPGDSEAGYGPVYSTSMAVLALAVDRHVLPAYQR